MRHKLSLKFSLGLLCGLFLICPLTLQAHSVNASRAYRTHINKSNSNPIKHISWKQVNNTKWVYHALKQRKLFNYFKYNDKNNFDKLQIKKAYPDVKKGIVRPPYKIYKLMWVKDYDFLHHGESWNNTKNGMKLFNKKNHNISSKNKHSWNKSDLQHISLSNPKAYGNHEMIPTKNKHIFYTAGHSVNDSKETVKSFSIKKGNLPVNSYPSKSFNPIVINNGTQADKLFNAYKNNSEFQYGFDDADNNNNIDGTLPMNDTIHTNMLLATSKPYQIGWILGATNGWSATDGHVNGIYSIQVTPQNYKRPDINIYNSSTGNLPYALSNARHRLIKEVQWGLKHPQNMKQNWYNVGPID